MKPADEDCQEAHSIHGWEYVTATGLNALLAQ